MKAIYNKIHQVEIEEQEIPGMAGEVQLVLMIIFPDDNPDQLVSNKNLHYFDQDDREELVKWLDEINEVNAASAKSFSV
jgi:hypothetical protein